MNVDTTGSSSHPPIGFSFRKRWNRINWRSLASIDVDRIAQEMDIQALQANIINIAFCNVESEDFHNLDTNFIKVFRLAQLTIEYLLHSQQYLSDRGTQLEERVEAAQQDLKKAQQQLSIKADEFKALKKENRKRRQLIETYQDMMNSGATGLHTCSDCGRGFVSAEYLRSHIHRRHPDHLLPESKELKTSFDTQYDVLEKRLQEQMLEHLKVNEKQFRDEMEEKERESLEAHAKEFDEWKKGEQSKIVLTMQEFKEPILDELRNLRQEKASLEETLQQTQAELRSMKTKKISSLGQLEGAEIMVEGGSKEIVEKTMLDINQVKEDLETQVREMHFALKKQEKVWEKRLHKLGSTCQDQIKDSMEKLQILEDSLLEITEGKDRSHHQTAWSQQLKSFHEQLKQHEKQLHSQQKQLSSLQSQDSLPNDVGICTASPSRSNIWPSIAPSGPEVGSLSDSGSSICKSDTTSVNEDEVNTHFYKHQSEIRTLFAHKPEVLEGIKQESRTILRDALVQRGVDENALGISMSQFESKLRSLSEERQKRVERHYNFTDIRGKVHERLDTIAKRSYGDQEHKDNQPELKLNMTAVSLPAAGKPPKPSLAKPSSSQCGTVNSNDTSFPSAARLGLITSEVAVKETKVVDSAPSSAEVVTVLSSESSQMFVSDKQSIKGVYQNDQQAGTDVVHQALTADDDSPWDSTEEQVPSEQSSSPLQDEVDDSLDMDDMSSLSAPIKSQRINTSSDTYAKLLPQTGLKPSYPPTCAATSSVSVLTTVSSDFDDSKLSN